MKDATEFLQHFPGEHIYVTMPEDSAAPMHHHRPYEDIKSLIKIRNGPPDGKDDWQHGVFFTVNNLDQSRDKNRHRTKKMVTRCRAIFMDADIPVDEPRTDFPLEPSLVVNTSPGKYHYYWLIEGGTDDFEQWDLIQKALIFRYEGDKQAKDLTRYLRLPGYYHNKDRDNPYMVNYSGEGQTYAWADLCEAFPPRESTEVQEVTGEAVDGDAQSDKEIMDIIANAKPGLHGAINKFMLGRKRDGMARQTAIDMIQIMGAAVSGKDERTANRYSTEELIRSWEGASGGASEDISLPDEAPERTKYQQGEFPWPPGYLGELAQLAYDNQLYQHREIAVISAIGLIAGVCGRKFNFHRNGLNVYMTLIMRTGGGKDSINDFISGILNQFAPIGQQSSFIGPQRFTGPKAVNNALENALCMVCVFTEAGLLLKSKAGDKDGLSRTLLSMYSKSAKGKWSGTEEFSSEENRIKPLPSPAFSIINEATPETLLDALSNSGALEKGELPRQSIYRVDKDKPRPNPDYGLMDYELSGEISARIKDLVDSCAKVQVEPKPDVHVMKLDPALGNATDEIMEYYRNIENEYQDTDLRRSIMASRSAIKVMKFAALATCLNYDKSLIIREAEWEWAKAMVEYEMLGMDFFFQGSGGNEMEELVRGYMGKQIWKVIMGKCAKGVAQSDAQQRKQGVFPLSGLRNICRSSSKLAGISDDPMARSKPIDGLTKTIDYMVASGLLVDVGEKGRKLYKITNDFRMMMYHENK